jgi:hypothetical protein
MTADKDYSGSKKKHHARHFLMAGYDAFPIPG